jgi:transmembrane sensor
MRFAATIVFVLAGSVMLYVGTSRFRAAKSTVVWHYAAERGQFTNVQLPDGSQVALAPDSRLTFTEIGRSDRRVILEGRAVFSVHHDAQRRFIVAAGRAETEDVGTLFAVDAYPKEDDVHVAVREGQVAVRSVSARDSGGALLSAGDIVRMDATGTVQRLSGEDVPDYFEWTKHVERLHGQTLEQVLREVNRWYGADVRVIDSKLRAHPLTVTIDANVPLQQLLVTIAAATGARVESRGASNILTPKVP